MNNLDFNFFCSNCKQSREYRESNCFTKYRIRTYDKGEYIAFKGDPVRELSIVVKGSINVSFILDSGVIMRSVDHPSPVPIGGVALFSKENRYLVDTKAIEPCTIISVSRDEITSQMNRCEDFLMSFIDYSASRVDVLAKHIAILSQRNIRAKLAFYLLICSNGSNQYTFARSIRQLSEYICVERPSLSRVISEFVDEGIITYRNGRGEILDLNRVKSFVE